MNKSAIQRFAIWARTEMKTQVKQRAYQYGITEEGYGDANAITIGGRALSPVEQNQRKELVAQIQRKGYEQVMEEVAYTWFNRFIALRYMEINNYLPSHIRVFSDSTGAFKPEILNDVLHLDLPGLDSAKVAELIESNQAENLYRYLLLTQCNALNEALPQMFERMGGYTELLLPNNILKQDGILGRMVAEIPEEDWTDQVQIIGWLYQYYNSEYKDETFALLKKNVKITKERIPSATQLFTPDWIVRYMVENSLGRLWLEGHPDDELKSGWKYYLDEAPQEAEVEAQLEKIREEYRSLKPQDIKVIDPCMGSGHILVYAFDVLIQIYRKYGVSERDAAQSILRNNLYGLDIDDRAAQLAYFAVMMKARQYDRRIFSRGIQPNVYAIVESNGIDGGTIDYFIGGNPEIASDFNILMHEMRDAKEYGSILNISQLNFEGLKNRVDEVFDDISMYRDIVLSRIWPLIQVAEVMAQKYDVVVTNPPYMGASNMNPTLNEFIKCNYADYKSDFFSAFFVRSIEMTKPKGKLGFFSPYVWMFIQSYEKWRTLLCLQKTIETLIQFEYSAFEEATVPVCAFTFSNFHINKFAPYLRLTEFRGGMEVQRLKTLEAVANHNCGFYFEAQASNFSKIPGSPVAYWVSKAMYGVFGAEKIKPHFDVKAGICTGENNKFIVLWPEVDFNRSSLMSKDYLYTPHNKGGEYRKWYGNRDYFLKYNARALSQMEGNAGFRHDGKEYYFRPHIGWSKITSAKSSFRLFEEGFTFDSAGLGLFSNKADMLTTLAMLNSVICEKMLSILNPTLNVTPVIVKELPYPDVDAHHLVNSNIALSKADWDSFETSWDFTQHPLVTYRHSVSKAEIEPDWNNQSWYLKNAYEAWEYQCKLRFDTLKANEEELNRIFIDIYGLQDELTPEVEDKDVTVRKADLGRDIRSLISYAVGCMFGRYSLDVPGLAYAGGNFEDRYRKDRLGTGTGFGITFGGTGISASKEYTSICVNGEWQDLAFAPVTDNIIPICDDDYFDDDITGRFVKWVETVYGKETLKENLKFIADALGGKGTPREVIRSYFLNDFYADHLKIYQKRPIYWLFDSGKKNGFKALIYMHRYQSDLLAKMRTDYVHEQQERYRTQLAHLSESMDHASTSERVKLTKRQKKIQEQALEIQKYEEKIHHLADQNISIDLDDGVKHNYALFADVLAKIK